MSIILNCYNSAINDREWKHNRMKKQVTHYDSLQVSPTANSSVIRAAFKALSQKLHPDKHQNNYAIAHKNFHAIKLAYDILSNPESRKEYDLWIEHNKFKIETSHKKSKQLFNYYTFKEIKPRIYVKA